MNLELISWAAGTRKHISENKKAEIRKYLDNFIKYNVTSYSVKIMNLLRNNINPTDCAKIRKKCRENCIKNILTIAEVLSPEMGKSRDYIEKIETLFEWHEHFNKIVNVPDLLFEYIFIDLLIRYYYIFMNYGIDYNNIYSEHLLYSAS